MQTLDQFKTQRLAKDVITIAAIIIITLVSLSVRAQTKPIPDTAVIIKTTNNQLYQLNALFSFASGQLLKSEASVKDYVEFQKQYQALLGAWFKQKEDELKDGKKEKTK